MTAVIIRRVENRLQAMVRARDGMRPREALAAAEANLASLETICREELALRLDKVKAFIDRDPSRRPASYELDQLIHDADAALTACGALGVPALGRALVMLCAQADALRQSQYWPPGALNPAVELIVLLYSGRLPESSAGLLLGELERCLATYLNHSGHG